MIEKFNKANENVNNGITLYCIGCEPAIQPYRDFYILLSLITGGRYLPLNNADLLSNVITL